MFTSQTVTVVTAATGHRNLQKCLQSVQRQTYPRLEHLVVIDGPEHDERVGRVLEQRGHSSRPLQVIHLPSPTGKDKWCGHRIYAAMSFLTNCEFICYLDEDNWFEPDHVESLVAALRGAGAQWAFALRNIVDEEGRFITRDECESLGNLHHVFNNQADVLVDTNCYLLRREVAVRFAPVWYRPTRPPGGEIEPDRLLCRLLLQHCPQVGTNRRHTLNYTVGNRPDSVRAEFFLYGNQVMHNAYPLGLPWEHNRKDEG